MLPLMGHISQQRWVLLLEKNITITMPNAIAEETSSDYIYENDIGSKSSKNHD